VVIAGRREEKLDEFASKYENGRVEKVVMDITDFSTLKEKVGECMGKVSPPPARPRSA
jgi:NADP-dependent 3-hydroxy acid dehydrogenase YdfG